MSQVLSLITTTQVLVSKPGLLTAQVVSGLWRADQLGLRPMGNDSSYQGEPFCGSLLFCCQQRSSTPLLSLGSNTGSLVNQYSIPMSPESVRTCSSMPAMVVMSQAINKTESNSSLFGMVCCWSGTTLVLDATNCT